MHRRDTYMSSNNSMYKIKSEYNKFCHQCTSDDIHKIYVKYSDMLYWFRTGLGCFNIGGTVNSKNCNYTLNSIMPYNKVNGMFKYIKVQEQPQVTNMNGADEKQLETAFKINGVKYINDIYSNILNNIKLQQEEFYAFRTVSLTIKCQDDIDIGIQAILDKNGSYYYEYDIPYDNTIKRCLSETILNKWYSGDLDRYLKQKDIEAELSELETCYNNKLYRYLKYNGLLVENEYFGDEYDSEADEEDIEKIKQDYNKLETVNNEMILEDVFKTDIDKLREVDKSVKEHTDILKNNQIEQLRHTLHKIMRYRNDIDDDYTDDRIATVIYEKIDQILRQLTSEHTEKGVKQAQCDIYNTAIGILNNSELQDKQKIIELQTFEDKPERIIVEEFNSKELDDILQIIEKYGLNADEIHRILSELNICNCEYSVRVTDMQYNKVNESDVDEALSMLSSKVTEIESDQSYGQQLGYQYKRLYNKELDDTIELPYDYIAFNNAIYLMDQRYALTCRDHIRNESSIVGEYIAAKVLDTRCKDVRYIIIDAGDKLEVIDMYTASDCDIRILGNLLKLDTKELIHNNDIEIQYAKLKDRKSGIVSRILININEFDGNLDIHKVTGEQQQCKGKVQLVGFGQCVDRIKIQGLKFIGDVTFDLTDIVCADKLHMDLQGCSFLKQCKKVQIMYRQFEYETKIEMHETTLNGQRTFVQDQEIRNIECQDEKLYQLVYYMMCDDICESDDSDDYSDKQYKEARQLADKMNNTGLNWEDVLRLAWRNADIQVVAYKQLVK